MIKGIGVDAVDLSRNKDNMNERFINRILSDDEINRYNSLKSDKRKLEYLAGRFAAKEAYSKALGTGIGKVTFKEIETAYHDNGQPYIKSNENTVHLSITHTDSVAIAYVVIE
jgi:holo-[acyl-carrier protein] synthase